MALDLGKQVGPMPLGAWLAVVGTGVGVALWSRGSGNGDAAPVVTRDTTTDPLTGEDAVGTGPGWVATPPPSGSPGGVQVLADNDAWGNAAITLLIARGYDPALSQSAIAHALQGGSMSVREYALWAVALAALGPPPFAVDVVPPVSTGGPTPVVTRPPPTPAAPARGHWYRIGSTGGWTLHKLATRWYGNPARWRDIYEANRDNARRPQGIAPNPHAKPGWIGSADPDHKFRFSGLRWVWIPA